MDIDGEWQIVLRTPLGAQPAVLQLRANGETLEGAMASKLGSGVISDGAVKDGALSWTASFNLPRPGPVAFSARIDGDAIAGTGKAASLVAMPFKGVRREESVATGQAE